MSDLHDAQIMSLEIRLMRDDELDDTVAVFHRSKRAALTFLPTEMEHTIEDDRGYFSEVLMPKAQVWVALKDDRIVGLLALAEQQVEQLYVDTEHQGTGVGAALLSHAKSQSPAGLTLYTHQKNTRARRFYEKHGFVPIRFGISPAPESEPDVFFRWSPE